jgi:F-type H+-transporting ATPase subunit delta
MMISRANAVRYARDLFDVAWRHDQAAQVADELDAFAAVQREHTGEARPLFHPLVPAAEKLKTIHELSGKLGLSKPTTVLLEALAHAYQIHVLEWVAASFRDRLNRKTGVVQAKVTTAAPLATDKAAALQARLAELTGRTVQLSTTVNPSIIGGVVTQIDSTVYDGSVTRQLARMRARLVENV